ncbi:MAG: aldehyde dehydrogenase family protein [Gemmatimonadales bacterium]|nr:aldehyde dehydrogenase family protein [Gemmatimonadales bacterium]
MSSTILPQFIGGAFVASGSSSQLTRHNPSDLSDLVATVPIGSAADVDHAVSAAASAAAAWRRLPGPARADALYRWGEVIAARADELALAIAREVGKPIGEARGEVGRATVICRYYAGEAVRDVGEVIPAQAPDALQFTLHDPLGVVALITPWNFPLAIPLWKAAPALAFGNTVVLKGSELSPRMSHLLAETAVAANLPAGVFNVVQGDGTTGAALVGHPDVRAVSFTGSQRVGGIVAAAATARNVRYQTEMGGKNVVIVARDADLDRAAALTAAGAMRYAGQKCTATSRVIVERSVEDAFLAKLGAAVAALPLGPVTDAASAVGPMITPEAHQRVTRALEAAGVERLCEGAAPEDGDKGGNWFQPVVVRLPSAADDLARQELFAPVLGLLRADDLDHAIALANDTSFGLSASLFTSDLSAAMRYVRAIEVGLVRVNGDTTGVDPHAPFGGMKGSSSGTREQGRAARDFYTETRTIQIHS